MFVHDLFPASRWLIVFTSLGCGSRPHNNLCQEPVRSLLVKQTYSVYVNTSWGRRKWHLSVYGSEDAFSMSMDVSDMDMNDFMDIDNLDVLYV